jgi:hypothetical protein
MSEIPPFDAAAFPQSPDPNIQMRPPYSVVAFWREDPRTKKTFAQYSEVQVATRPPEGEEEEPTYEFYPLVLMHELDELLTRWSQTLTIPEALRIRRITLERSQKYFSEALEASDNPHCETFVVQTAMNFLTTVELFFHLIYFPESLPLFFDAPTVARAQQTSSLYIWLDPYLGGLSKRDHKPLDVEEASWPAKDEFYYYFRRKSDPTVSPQELANIWRTSAARIVDLEEECRGKIWEWLKGQHFSEEEIRALVLEAPPRR